MGSNHDTDTPYETAREKAALEKALGTLDTIADGERKPANYAELKKAGPELEPGQVIMAAPPRASPPPKPGW